MKTLGTWMLVICAGFGLNGCQNWTAVTGIESPDGSLRADVLKSISGGGTVGAVYRVLVAPGSKPLDLARQRAPSWESYRVPVRYLFWRDGSTLEVVVSAKDQAQFDTIKVVHTDGVHIETRVMTGTAKEAVFGETTLLVTN